jgi:hypothetical protein
MTIPSLVESRIANAAAAEEVVGASNRGSDEEEVQANVLTRHRSFPVRLDADILGSSRTDRLRGG